jgi:hypothetical protein
VPDQKNGYFGNGPARAMRYTGNIQPVIPISLNRDWILITRTIVAFSYAESAIAGGRDVSGLVDIVQSFFLPPGILL